MSARSVSLLIGVTLGALGGALSVLVFRRVRTILELEDAESLLTRLAVQIVGLESQLSMPRASQLPESLG